MSNALRILIVEDEFLTLDAIKTSIQSVGYTTSGIAKKASEALEILDQGKTDIAILDINIKGDKNGIWLAHKINASYNIPFIFLTAYSDKDTIQSAINTSPYGYLIKPFTNSSIYTSIEIAINNFNNKQLTRSKNQELKTEHAIDDSFFIKDKDLYHKILIKDILYIKSELKYIEIYIKNRVYLYRFTLTDFLALLPKKHFTQVHRSYIVQNDEVTKISAHTLYINQHEIPYSLKRKDEILSAFSFLPKT